MKILVNEAEKQSRLYFVFKLSAIGDKPIATKFASFVGHPL